METLKVLLIIEPTSPIQIYQNYIMSENENYYSLCYTNSLTSKVSAFYRVPTLGIPSQRHDTTAQTQALVSGLHPWKEKLFIGIEESLTSMEPFHHTKAVF